MDYHTLDKPICNLYIGLHAFVLLIKQLQSPYPLPAFKIYQLHQRILQIFSACAIFTHVIEKRHGYLQANIQITVEDTLQYADVSYSVAVYDAVRLGCDQYQRNYLAVPVRNADGQTVAVTIMLREHGWRGEEVEIFQTALRYLEYHVAEHDAAMAPIRS